MYKEFYGFTIYPFALTPDPQFLYPSRNYANCRHSLLQSLEREPGLLVLTGESGTGKTFLLNALMQEVDKRTHVVFLSPAKLGSKGVLQYISQEFELDTTEKSHTSLLTNLENFLLICAMSNKKVLLIIDEAHSIAVDALKELQLLVNFENTGKKTLQIVLAGHSGLKDILALPELEQLRKCTGLHCCLLPMDYDETQHYIKRRLAVAGAQGAIFTSKAMKEIFLYSQGIPKFINLICDLALLSGFGDAKRVIERTRIQRVIKAWKIAMPDKPLRYHTRQQRVANWVQTHRVRRPHRLALVVGTAAGLILGAGVVLQTSLAHRNLGDSPTKSVPSPAVSVLPHPVQHAQPPLDAQSLLPQRPVWCEQPLLPQQGPAELPTR
jgi:general secretion pathway protein A